MNDLPGVMKKLALGNPEKDEVLYQYATAFPVACALAQTWNTEPIMAALSGWRRG